MKLICIVAHLFLFRPTTDSVNLRIYNNSKYYVLDYSLKYDSIPPHSFSKYKKVPYVYDANESECTFIFRPLLGRSKKVTIDSVPFDHNSDKKQDNGVVTLSLEIIKHKKEVTITTTLKTGQ
jgi:hypothetical protein